MKPIICVTPNMEKNFMKLNKDYYKAINSFGGVSLVVCYDENIDEIINISSGILLTGGGDISERFLGEMPNSLFRNIIPERDKFEISLCQKALAVGMPVLGICRGLQVMAVACGAKIIPDIIGHFQNEDRTLLTHTVKIDKSSKLYDIVKEDVIAVNSFHHQAVKDLPETLFACGYSEDMVIEAIEHKTHPFYIGVQWHPENIFSFKDENKKIFDTFIKQSIDFHNHYKVY